MKIEILGATCNVACNRWNAACAIASSNACMTSRNDWIAPG